MREVIALEALLAAAAEHEGRLVSVTGQFIAMYGESYLCEPSAELEVTPDRRKIKLDYVDIEDRCVQVVGGYGGGPWYYHDAATVTGRFVVGADGAMLTELSELIIHRSAQDYRVPLA